MVHIKSVSITLWLGVQVYVHVGRGLWGDTKTCDGVIIFIGCYKTLKSKIKAVAEFCNRFNTNYSSQKWHINII